MVDKGNFGFLLWVVRIIVNLKFFKVDLRVGLMEKYMVKLSVFICILFSIVLCIYSEVNEYLD